MINKLKIIFKLSLKNILRHPVKNVLIGIVIFIASLLFFINGSLNDSAEKTWNQYFSKTFTGDYHVTTSKGLERDYTLPSFTLPKKTVPDEIINYLEQNKVFYAKRLKLGGVVFNEEKSEFEGTLPTLIGVEWEKELQMLSNIKEVEGKFDPKTPNGIMVWKEYADSLKWKTGQEVTLYIKDTDNNAYPYTLKVMGILNHKEGAALEGKGVVIMFPAIYISYAYLAQKLGVETGRATDIAIWDETRIHEKKIKSLSDKLGCQFFPGAQGYGVVWGIVELLGFFGSAFALLILVILIVATLNLNMMGFFERQKEIGAMISMGAKPGWIVTLLVMENIVFSTVVFISAALFYLLLISLNTSGVDFGEMNSFFAGKTVFLSLVPSALINGYLTVVVTMLISAVYPIYLTSKINPVEVFREAKI